MKKTSLLFSITLSALISFQSLGQGHKLDLRFGAGVAFMGSGDKFIAGFENELNHNFNSYLSGSASLAFGTTVGAVKTTDPNLHLPPF